MTRTSDLKYGSNYGKPGGPVTQVVNLQRAAHCVAMRQPFEANQCKGLWVQQRLPYRELHDELISEITVRRNYVVYSGVTDYALPLFVYDEFAEAWFENTDDLYGNITTKQRRRLRPAGHEVHPFDNVTLHAISQFGYAHVAKLRLERKSSKRSWQDELRAYVSANGSSTGRWSSPHPTMQELINEWRKKHIVNGGPSLNQIYDELVKLKSGGKKP